jgi:hypothetical protein
VPATAGTRQVAVTAPSAVTPGKAFTAQVTLTAGGNQTLHGVRLAVQLPQGWRPAATSQTTYGTVQPGQAITATFIVTGFRGCPRAVERARRNSCPVREPGRHLAGRDAPTAVRLASPVLARVKDGIAG